MKGCFIPIRYQFNNYIKRAKTTINSQTINIESISNDTINHEEILKVKNMNINMKLTKLHSLLTMTKQDQIKSPVEEIEKVKSNNKCKVNIVDLFPNAYKNADFVFLFNSDEPHFHPPTYSISFMNESIYQENISIKRSKDDLGIVVIKIFKDFPFDIYIECPFIPESDFLISPIEREYEMFIKLIKKTDQNKNNKEFNYLQFSILSTKKDLLLNDVFINNQSASVNDFIIRPNLSLVNEKLVDCFRILLEKYDINQDFINLLRELIHISSINEHFIWRNSISSMIKDWINKTN